MQDYSNNLLCGIVGKTTLMDLDSIPERAGFGFIPVDQEEVELLIEQRQHNNIGDVEVVRRVDVDFI